MIGDSSAVKTLISKLRKKIEPSGYDIETLYGKGYIFTKILFSYPNRSVLETFRFLAKLFAIIEARRKKTSHTRVFCHMLGLLRVWSANGSYRFTM